MKISLISVLAFLGAAVVTYSTRKRAQHNQQLRYAVTHPISPIAVLKARAPQEDKVLAKVLDAGLSEGYHSPAWAKRTLLRHLKVHHSN